MNNLKLLSGRYGSVKTFYLKNIPRDIEFDLQRVLLFPFKHCCCMEY